MRIYVVGVILKLVLRVCNPMYVVEMSLGDFHGRYDVWFEFLED